MFPPTDYKPIDHLEHARALAYNAQMTDDPEMSAIYAAIANTHATVAQAEALARIADALEQISATVIRYNGAASISIIERFGR